MVAQSALEEPFGGSHRLETGAYRAQAFIKKAGSRRLHIGS